MSKNASLSGTAIDFSLIRSAIKDDLVSLLQEIEGPKCVVLDMSLSKSINTVLEGASIFKENQVVTFIKLTGEPVVTEARSIVFICKTDKDPLDKVIQVMTALRKERNDYSFHLFFVPRETQRAVQYLRDHKVYEFLSLRELHLDMIPIDNDILSMELEDSFGELYCDQDGTCLKTLADALLELQIIYGPFKTIDTIGNCSETVLRIMQAKKPSQFFTKEWIDGIGCKSSIQNLVIVDRAVDLASVFVTPLTYEALIHEFITINAGSISVDGGIVGKTEGVPAIIPMNSNDMLFCEIADYNISVIPKFLKEKSHEVQAMYNSRPKDSQCSISELSSFVKKVGTIQELVDSVQTHLGIANLVTTQTNGAAFGTRWQRDRELVEGENILPAIRDMLNEEIELEAILHFLILYSIVNSGLKKKDFDAVRQDLLVQFGFQYLPLLSALERSGLLVQRNSTSNYSSIKSKLRLVRDDINGTEPSDVNYVTSGYAPISARVLQALLFNTAPMTEVTKLIGASYSHREQEVEMVESEKRVVVIVFVGGLTYLEVSAIRLLQRMNPALQILFLTTNMVKEKSVMEGLLRRSQLQD